MAERRFEAASRFRICRALDLGDCAAGDHFAAVDSGPRAQIDNVIGASHRLLVVLDDDERISFSPQSTQGIEQPQIIARMQSNRRFIQDVENAP